MKKFLIAVMVIICLGAGAAAALNFTGVIDLSEYFSRNEEAQAAFYVSFMDDYFLMDSSGVVLKSTLSEPEGIPEIENMRFNSFTVGCEADPESSSTFDYVQEVCLLLVNYDISVSSIEVSDDGELTLYLTGGDFSVVLGSDDGTDIKIKDLCSLYPSLITYNGGVLYMTSADTAGQGYTFRENTDEEDEEEETSSEESEETQESTQQTDEEPAA